MSEKLDRQEVRKALIFFLFSLDPSCQTTSPPIFDQKHLREKLFHLEGLPVVGETYGVDCVVLIEGDKVLFAIPYSWNR